MADYNKDYPTDKNKIDRIKQLEKECTRIASKMKVHERLEAENAQLTSDLVRMKQELAEQKAFIAGEVESDCGDIEVQYHQNAHDETAEECERLRNENENLAKETAELARKNSALEIDNAKLKYHRNEKEKAIIAAYQQSIRIIVEAATER